MPSVIEIQRRDRVPHLLVVSIAHDTETDIAAVLLKRQQPIRVTAAESGAAALADNILELRGRHIDWLYPCFHGDARRTADIDQRKFDVVACAIELQGVATRSSSGMQVRGIAGAYSIRIVGNGKPVAYFYRYGHLRGIPRQAFRCPFDLYSIGRRPCWRGGYTIARCRIQSRRWVPYIYGSDR